MKTPDGLKRLRNAGYPWSDEAADLIEEMALAISAYGTYGDNKSQKQLFDALKKYEEWK